MRYRQTANVYRRIVTCNAALLFVAASVLSVAVPMVTSGVARAATPGSVVINEFSANGGSDWVELYNNSGAAVDLSGWELHDSTSKMKTLSTVLPANGFSVVEVSNRLNANNDEIHLIDNTSIEIDALTYNTTGSILYPASGESTARTTDAGNDWATGAPTKGTSNGIAPAPLTPELNAENFNTVDGNYKGVSVGFNTKNFGTVIAVRVELERTDGSIVTKHGNQGVFDIISDKAAKQQLTAPFVIQEGAFTEASDTFYWDPAPAAWNTATVPVKATIYVTDESGTEVAANTVFNHGAPSWPTYQSLLPPVHATEIVSGDTAVSENQPGWMFNRDVSTATPYEFNKDQQSIGDGSLYVLPIGANPSDKFIAENFLAKPVQDVKSISYDFMIGAGGSPSDASKFYLNVYANIDDSANYYDCRYDYVPTTGSATSFTTATFKATDTPVHVQKRGSRIAACPATLAGMPSGSFVRAFAVNVGDTSANDVGLDGYLDNIVIDATSKITTYDFEPKAAPLVPDPEDENEVTPPADEHGSRGSSSVSVTIVSTPGQTTESREPRPDTTPQADDTTQPDSEAQTGVLADSDRSSSEDENNAQTDEQQVSETGSAVWWWLLALLALALLLYVVLRHRKGGRPDSQA